MSDMLHDNSVSGSNHPLAQDPRIFSLGLNELSPQALQHLLLLPQNRFQYLRGKRLFFLSFFFFFAAIISRINALLILIIKLIVI